jgi:hypothetical protein
MSHVRLALLLLAGSAGTASAQRHSDAARFRITNGARVEPSGFLTVEQAPPSAAAPAARQRGGNEQTFYAELAGVSNAEAARRMREQEALRPAVERLVRTLRQREKGNFTDVEIIHKPHWAYLLYFKREPAKTLAKYTRNPRFNARWSRYSNGDLRTLSKSWTDRFERERLVTGYGMNARRGTADIDMVVSQDEFAAIAARHGWGPVPAFLRLKFASAPVGPAVDPLVANGVRLFPQSDRNLGIHNQAALGGRIVLRDGCFRIIGLEGKEQLAYFPREIGLYIDPQGYLALRSRSAEPRHLGRIGEAFSWAGPIGIGEDAPMAAALRKQCGNAPLMHVAIPESRAIFNARYGLPRPPPPPPPRVRPR